MMRRDRLHRLWRMPAAEIRGRARQESLKLRERFSPGARREMSDRELMRHFSRQVNSDRRSRTSGFGGGTPDPERTVALILNRLCRATGLELAGGEAAPALFPSLARRAEIVQTMQERFPEQRAAIIGQADDACLGLFYLLGFEGLSFGKPIDWRLEPISGKRTPLCHWSKLHYLNPDIAGDKKITWELNRHQHFVTLGQAYWMTGDERYALAFADQVTSWMNANPPGLGINWASSLELSFRLISWIWALHFFAGSECLSPTLMLRVMKYVIAQAGHIDSFGSDYFSPNTHLTGEGLGLLYAGVSFPELRHASYWRERGIQILLGQLSLQILPDGVYFERSTYYHRYTVDFYTHFLLLMRGSMAGPKLTVGADPTGTFEGQVREGLAAMLEHLMWLADPEGRAPLIGDDDGGRLVRLGVRDADDSRDTLCTGSAMFGGREWKYVAGDAAVETLWLLGPEGLRTYDSMGPVEPARRDREFAHGGVYVMRDGWSKDSTCVFLIGGGDPPKSTAHAHADALSFQLASGGNQWLVDPGTLTYTGSAAERERFRSALSHNAAVIDGLAHSESDGPFLWRRLDRAAALQFSNSDSLSYFRGSQDGYMRRSDPVEYTRQFALVRAPLRAGGGRPASYLVLSDEFVSSGPHTYEIKFMFDPSCALATRGDHLLARHTDGSILQMFVGGIATVTASVQDCSVSRSYGAGQKASAAVIRSAGSGLRQIVSVILPSRDGMERLVRQKSCREPGLTEIAVDWPDHEDDLLVANSLGAPGGLDRLNASIGFSRRRRGLLELAALVDGDRFVADDFSIISSTAMRHCEVVITSETVVVKAQGSGALDLEIAVLGRCLHIAAPAEQRSRTVVRSFDLRRASVRSSGK